MKELIYKRKGLGVDKYSHAWFSDMLHIAKEQIKRDQLADAEYTIAFANLFALERMDSKSLKASLNVLSEILERRGVTLEEYLKLNGSADQTLEFAADDNQVVDLDDSFDEAA